MKVLVSKFIIHNLNKTSFPLSEFHFYETKVKCQFKSSLKKVFIFYKIMLLQIMTKRYICLPCMLKNVFIPVWYFVLASFNYFLLSKRFHFFRFNDDDDPEQTFIKHYREILLLPFHSRVIKFSDFVTAIALKHFIKIDFFRLNLCFWFFETIYRSW